MTIELYFGIISIVTLIEISYGGGEDMNVKVLKHYFKFCERYDLVPSFTGLKEFHSLTKGLYIP